MTASMWIDERSTHDATDVNHSPQVNKRKHLAGWCERPCRPWEVCHEATGSAGARGVGVGVVGGQSRSVAPSRTNILASLGYLGSAHRLTRRVGPLRSLLLGPPPPPPNFIVRRRPPEPRAHLINVCFPGVSISMCAIFFSSWKGSASTTAVGVTVCVRVGLLRMMARGSNVE